MPWGPTPGAPGSMLELILRDPGPSPRGRFAGRARMEGGRMGEGRLTGFEPATSWTTTRCSTPELQPPCDPGDYRPSGLRSSGEGPLVDTSEILLPEIQGLRTLEEEREDALSGILGNSPNILD